MSGSAWSGRPLRLPTPPDPGHAAELAQHAADAARSIHGVELDYTPASLSRVDVILGEFQEPGSDALAETIFAFGCYIGEVLVRNAGYRWVTTPAELTDALGPLTVHRTSPMNRASPIDNGLTDSVAYFYVVFGGTEIWAVSAVLALFAIGDSSR